jgi:hypothetical protein
MSSMQSTRVPTRSTLLALLTSLVATALALLAGEVLIRWIDGYSLNSPALRSNRPPAAPVWTDLAPFAGDFAAVPRAAGIDADWYALDPRRADGAFRPDPALEKRYWGHPGVELPSIYVWNRNFVTDETCRNNGQFLGLRDAFVYEPVRDTLFPRYRFPSGKSLPSGIATNAFGWRGPAVALGKPKGTVRVAFVGASTTVNAHAYPFSYPEHIGAWLNVWAERRGIPAKFEVINAGREGTNSNDFAAVVRDELMPLDPDMVVYYEGSNQFWPTAFVEWPEGKLPPKPTVTFKRSRLGQYSAIWRRVRNLVASLPGSGKQELPRSFGKVAWPPGLNETAPDPAYPDLPVNLNTILADVDSIRATLAPARAELVLSSFVWLVHDGMTLDTDRHGNIFRYLNETFWPFPYAHMRRMADFQNRTLLAYARRHGVEFIDVDAHYPRQPDLFDDAIHMNPAGIRLHAWIAFNQIVPILERRLAAGALPRAPAPAPSVHPAFAVPPTLVDIAAVAAACGKPR